MHEHHKIFEKRYPDKSFPEYRLIKGSEAYGLRQNLLSELKLSNFEDTSSALKYAWNNAALIVSNFKEYEDSLSQTLHSAIGYIPEKVFINYRDMSEIYEIEMARVEKHISDLYFPGADDLDIFDETMEWLAILDHEGDLKLYK